MKTTNMLGGFCNSWRSALPNDLKVIAALALSAAAMLPIAAEAVNFPDADGSHDIASSTAWGGALPTTETEVAITGKTQTVTANSDVMLSSALLKNGLTTHYNYTLTFDMIGRQIFLQRWKHNRCVRGQQVCDHLGWGDNHKHGGMLPCLHWSEEHPTSAFRRVAAPSRRSIWFLANAN